MKSLTPLPLNAITIRDPLFGHYIGKLHAVLIPYQWSILNDMNDAAVPSGCLRNFRIAAGLEAGERYGTIFQDSDLAKWLEAVAYSLQTRADSELEARADGCIDLLAKAQCEDGYLNTYYTLTEPNGRWTNLTEGHELYCAGHFIEAAVAYFEATGKRRFLDIMCRNADLIDRVFGPEEGKLKGYPGHEELELALVKLYRATGVARYLKLSEFLIAQRGRKPRYFEEELARRGGKTHFDSMLMADPKYAQTHLPPSEQTSAEGHAVRATYLYCAMADIAQETHNQTLQNACRSIFHNIAREKLYLTGGVGSAEYGERFAAGFDLPNDTCYCETCASIGLALFSLRMCRLERDAAYADVMERALYNTILAGVNRDGNRFFYVNPLEVTPAFCDESTSLAHVKPKRQQWFDVACCPTNIARTLGSLGQYLFSVGERELFVNLYLSCDADLGTYGHLRIDTRYPEEGSVHIRLHAAEPLTLYLRIPGGVPLVSLTAADAAQTPAIERGYARLALRQGETALTLTLDVKPHLVYADVRVSSDAGKAALVKGPLVYCFEQADHGANLAALVLNASSEPSPCANPVDGTVSAYAVEGWREQNATDALYSAQPPVAEACQLKAVPYYCWSHRGRGEMRVWMRYRSPRV